MNRRSFIRKVIYIVCIGILLVPLSYFSQPATVAVGNQPASAGGKLAQLRDQHQISPSSLGEIDPAGETIKLATLGLRGVAVVMLWEKAKTAQMKEDWDGLQATLDQLTKLEPHFLIFWRHQAWNVSYNISVEWDDYHDRYRWVKEGIKLLLQGAKYNDREPLLIYDVGWTTAQKMGTADEKVQYRRLFREDDDEEFPDHRLRPQNRRDNWLVGQEYYERAISLVEDRGASIHRMNPLVFFSEPAMCQIDYAIALEEDGVFEEKAKVAWTDADDFWRRFGSRAIPTSFGPEIRLNEEEAFEQQAADMIKQLEALQPGLREKMVEERRAGLSAEDREALDAPLEQLSEEDRYRAFSARMKLNVPLQELAQRVDGPLRGKANRLADEAARLQDAAQMIHRDRDVVNFKYWRLRCEAEKTDPALDARRLVYEAKQLYENAQLEEAHEAYEKGFAQWRKVIDQFPEMGNDTVGGTSIEEAIKGYFDVLKQLGEPFPKGFVLKEIARGMLLRHAIPVPPEFQPTIVEEEPSRNEPAGDKPGAEGAPQRRSED